MRQGGLLVGVIPAIADMSLEYAYVGSSSEVRFP